MLTFKLRALQMKVLPPADAGVEESFFINAEFNFYQFHPQIFLEVVKQLFCMQSHEV